MLHDLNVYIVGRLLLAALLGGAIGLERELSHKPSGIRTNMLISIGAAMFTILSYEAARQFGGDDTRIAAQIIPGIGFIGAGVVIRARGTIIGITSAATIFVVASIGMAVGAGLTVTAVFATLLILTVLVSLGFMESRFGLHLRVMNFRLTGGNVAGLGDKVMRVVEEAGIEARRWHSHATDEGLFVEFEAQVTFAQQRDLLAKLMTLGVHCDARPIQPVTPL